MWDRTSADLLDDHHYIEVTKRAGVVVEHRPAGQQVKTISQISYLFAVYKKLLGIEEPYILFRENDLKVEMSEINIVLNIGRLIWKMGKVKDKLWFIPFRKQYLKALFLRKIIKDVNLFLTIVEDFYNFWGFLGERIRGLAMGRTPQMMYGDRPTAHLSKLGFL
jgi:hypothetical protein